MTNDNLKATTLTPGEVAFTLDPERPVLTHGRSMAAESSVLSHSHPRGQLLWSAKGILRISCENAVWVVPSSHAVWIPGGIAHQVSSETAAETRNLYIDPTYPVRQHESSVVMVGMSPLMREIIMKLTEQPSKLTPIQFKRLGVVAIDELDSLEEFKINIPSGNDPRLTKLINLIITNPHQQIPLTELVSNIGASVRTIERLFKIETGMTFRQWRSRFRLMNSMDQLNKGETTTSVAHQLGYRSVSSFIAAFKAEFGYTPQDYAKKKPLQSQGLDKL